MALLNFRKKFDSFLLIFARISLFEHFRGDWAYAEPNYFGELSKVFFFNVQFGPIRWVLRRFFKIWLFIVEICVLIWYFRVIFENYSMCMLSIRVNNFIAHRAYAETILSHTEHTRIKFHRTLSIRQTNFCVCSVCDEISTVSTWTQEETNTYLKNIIRKYAERMRNKFYRWLSMFGTNFIAGWACAEQIWSLADHTWKWLNVKKLNISAESKRIFKSLVLQALGTRMFRFLQKKKKKSCLCIPLTTHCSPSKQHIILNGGTWYIYVY
jgi:hypothetical protein